MRLGAEVPGARRKASLAPPPCGSTPWRVSQGATCVELRCRPARRGARSEFGARGSQDLHRHRCQHGSSNTDATPTPHAPAAASSASTKQFRCRAGPHPFPRRGNAAWGSSRHRATPPLCAQLVLRRMQGPRVWRRSLGGAGSRGRRAAWMAAVRPVRGVVAGE
jgi:hypothetical protein